MGLERIKDYIEYAVEVKHTGSRVICDPPPTDTDDDWLFLVDKEIVTKFQQKLLADGFKIGESRNYGPKSWAFELEEYPEVASNIERSKAFRSYRKDDLNIIITISPDHFENFCKATDLCAWLNLTDKQDRVAVFEAVCFDWWPEGRKDQYGEPAYEVAFNGLQILSETTPNTIQQLNNQIAASNHSFWSVSTTPLNPVDWGEEVSN